MDYDFRLRLGLEHVYLKTKIPFNKAVYNAKIPAGLIMVTTDANNHHCLVK